MAEPSREVDVTEGGLTLLLLVGLSVVSAAFYAGVRIGRSSAGEGVGRIGASAPATVARASPAGASTTSRPSPPSPPSRPAPAGSAPARRAPRVPRGFLGPPPLPSPRPVGGGPGAAVRGAARGVSVEVFWGADGEEAERVRVRLVGHGYPAYIVPFTGDGGATRYRVRVGDYATEGEATVVRDELRDGEGLTAATLFR